MRKTKLRTEAELDSRPEQEISQEPGSAGPHAPAVARRGTTALSLLGACGTVVPQALVAVSLVVLVVIVFVNIITRAWFGFSLQWEQEVTSLLLTLLAFVGAAVAYQRGMLASLGMVRDRVAARLGEDSYYEALLDCVAAGVAVLLLFGGIASAQASWSTVTPVLGFSTGWNSVCLAVGMGMLALYALARLAHRRAMDIAKGLGLFALLLAAELLAKSAAGSSGAIWVALVTLVVLIIAGAPIAIGLAAASLFYLDEGGTGPVTSAAMPQAMLDGIGNFVLVAVPLFIFAGLLMTEAGLSRRLVHALEALIGRVRGGLGHSVIVSMYLFSGISGSKVADVAAVGSALADEVSERGYSREDLAALLSASAVMGETVPPSVASLVAATAASLSPLAVFAAGLLPAVVIAVLLMLSVFRLAPKRADGAPVPWRAKVLLCVKALPTVAIGVILIGGLLTGFASPSEISAVACVIALVVGLLFRGFSPRGLLTMFPQTAAVCGMVLFMVSTASGFSYGLTLYGIPVSIGNALSSLHNEQWLFMLASVVILPVVGLFLEGLPAILVMVPLLTPVVTQMHINLVFYVIIIVLSLGMGTFLPPMGVGLLSACSVCKVEPSKVTRRLIPYMAIVFIGIIVIAFVPDIVLCIPRWLGVSVG